MLFSSKAKHRRPSKATRVAALAGVSGAVIAAPLLGATSASAASVETWDAVAQCESGGNWSIDTGNGYSGGLQFSPSSWAAAGGTQYAASAAQASKSQQIAAAERLLDIQGPGAWACAGAGGLTNDGVDPNVDTSGSQKQAEPQQEQAAPRQAEQPASRSEVRTAPKAETKAAAPIKKGDGEYKVKSGDTLGKIAKAEKVKGGWAKVFELNKDIVTDADVIYPGQQLHLK
ncbi:transglycosylase family protein [Streptomyces sp. 21So2-11]|uniref:LysM peptidoglycan-binding domain-containing protein n=1 Tax=Streptomyces sp. 21So2-11 TaxID=3144408 RepID=UPI00321A319E